jgi:hypothetical protein
MNSGRSFGRQAMSTSCSTWPMIAADVFTAGEFSWPTKCSGTRTCTGLSAEMRWKSTCITSGRYGCIWKSRSSTCSVLPSSSMSRIEAWNFSLRSEWNSGL